MGWMSDFHPFNKDLVADPSPKILVIVDRDGKNTAISHTGA